MSRPPTEYEVHRQQDAMCLQCNYPLRGIHDGRCPECGHAFDATEPATMNLTGKPIGRLARLLMKPPMRLFALLMLAVGLWQLWASRWPAGMTDDQRGVLHRIWFFAGFAWCAVLFARHRFIYRPIAVPPVTLYRGGTRWAWLPPVVAVGMAVLASSGLPFRVMIWGSWPALDAFAQQARSQPLQWGYPNRQFGLLEGEHIYATLDEVGIAVTNDPHGEWWLFHRSSGTPEHAHNAVPLGNAWMRAAVHHNAADFLLAKRWAAVDQLLDRPTEAARSLSLLTNALSAETPMTLDLGVGLGESEYACGFRTRSDEANPDALPEMPQIHSSIDLLRPDMHVLLRLGTAAVPAIQTALHDADPFVRARACFLAARMGPKAKQLVPDLAQLLSHADGSTREVAACALAHMGEHATPAVDALLTLLEDTDVAVRFNAAIALRHIGIHGKHVAKVIASIRNPPAPALMTNSFAGARSRQVYYRQATLDRLRASTAVTLVQLLGDVQPPSLNIADFVVRVLINPDEYTDQPDTASNDLKRAAAMSLRTHAERSLLQLAANVPPGDAKPYADIFALQLVDWLVTVPTDAAHEKVKRQASDLGRYSDDDVPYMLARALAAVAPGHVETAALLADRIEHPTVTINGKTEKRPVMLYRELLKQLAPQRPLVQPEPAQPPPTVAELAAMLKAVAWQDRQRAMRWLTREDVTFDDITPLLPTLREMALSERHSVMHRDALDAMRRYAPRDALDVCMSLLQRAIDSEDMEQRITKNAIESLGRLGASAAPAAPVLLKLAKHDAAWLDEHAFFYTLQQIGPPAQDAVPLLIQCLSMNPRSNVPAQYAARALGGIVRESPQLIEQFVDQYSKADIRRASYLLEGYARIGPAGAEALLPLIRGVLKSKHAPRSDLDRTLALIDSLGPHVIETLLPELTFAATNASGSGAVERAVIRLVKQLPPDDARVNALLAELADDWLDAVRLEAIHAITRRGPAAVETARPVLEARRHGDMNRDVREAIEAALAKS